MDRRKLNRRLDVAAIVIDRCRRAVGICCEISIAIDRSRQAKRLLTGSTCCVLTAIQTR
jgi:hypothetical protein